MRLHDVEEMWHNAARSDDPNAVLCFRDGRQVDVKTTPFFAYAHDCSVVVNRADRFSRVIHALCKRLEDAFPFVFCNVYLTPAGAQTVRAHSDDREVLAIQILGEKQWTVYGNPPTLNPYKAEEVGKGIAVDTSTLPVLVDEVVRTGDVLYVPRGWVHEARAPQECTSMHLTMAIQTSDWDVAAVARDGIGAWFKSLEAAEIARRVLSPPLLAGAQPASVDRDAFATLMEVAAKSVTVESGVAAWRARIKGLVDARDAGVRTELVPLDYPLQLNSAVLWNNDVQVDRIDESHSNAISSIRFVVHMRRRDGHIMPLSLSAATRPALLTLSRCTKCPIEVGDIPIRCPLARLALCNWLLRNGCIVRVT
jgi:hypothetical protein